MTEKPRIVIKSGKSQDKLRSSFIFNEKMVRSHDSDETINNYRRNSWKTYSDLPLPDKHIEAWRRTDIKDLDVSSFRIPDVDEYQHQPEISARFGATLTDVKTGGEILLYPGGAKIQLQQELSGMGVIFTDLVTAEKQYPDLVAKIIGKIVPPDDGKFSALTGALSQNGIFLYVPKGVEVKQPLHSMMWGPGNGLAYISHILVYLEERASATFIHEAASPQDETGQKLHSGIVEIYMEPASSLHFVELQSWGENVWNFSHERAKLGTDCKLDWIIGSIGSKLTKNFSNIELAGRGSNARMSGFFFTDNNQHIDHATRQDHFAPNTTSDLLFKGALSGNSRSVWQGMVYVSPDAVNTDGYQANRNLILSRDAHADSIPGLEICTDQVKCSHGSTVGKLDQDQLFYLLSRGISKHDAEMLLVEGFFDPIMQRIPLDEVRERFKQAIINKMA